MFGNSNSSAVEAPPRPQFPDFRVYEVLTKDGQWQKFEAHHAMIEQCGALMLARGIFTSPECQAPGIGAEPVMVFAPGEWRRCKTDYAGFQPPSELAI